MHLASVLRRLRRIPEVVRMQRLKKKTMKPISTPTPPPPSAPIRRRCAPATPSTSPARSRSIRAMQIVEGFENQVQRVFDNLQAVCKAAGGDFSNVVRVTCTSPTSRTSPR